MRQLGRNILLLFYAISVALSGATPASASDAALQHSSSTAEKYLLDAANQERAARGLPLLHVDVALSQAAETHAELMAARTDLSHQFAGEPDLSRRVAYVGLRFSMISENVADAPDPFTIHDMWMHSPGHRANLLDPKVDSIGIAVIDWKGQLYAVEDFATTVDELTIAQQEAAVADSLADSGMTIANDADARQTCAMPSGYVGERPSYLMRYTAASLDQVPEELQSRLGSGRYRRLKVGACEAKEGGAVATYTLAVMFYP